MVEACSNRRTGRHPVSLRSGKSHLAIEALEDSLSSQKGVLHRQQRALSTFCRPLGPVAGRKMPDMGGRVGACGGEAVNSVVGVATLTEWAAFVLQSPCSLASASYRRRPVFGPLQKGASGR